MPNGGRGDEPEAYPLALIGQQLLDAFDRCDSNRGWFSCIGEHDGRCESLWQENGKNAGLVCTCGADDLRAAFGRLTAALLIGRGV